MIPARSLRAPVEAARLLRDVGVCAAHAALETAHYHRRRVLGRARRLADIAAAATAGARVAGWGRHG